MTQIQNLDSESKQPIVRWGFLPRVEGLKTSPLELLYKATVWRLLDERMVCHTSPQGVWQEILSPSAVPARPTTLPGKPLKDLIAEARAKDETGALAQARKELARVRRDRGIKQGLSQLRLQAGLSQAEFAARLRTSQSYVARLEQGAIANPKLERLAQIADILNVSLENLSQALGRRA